jgi:hypothetical protein
MAVQRRNLFLYLTLICFIGIILIFIFDGYMGVYDSVSVTAGEFPQNIEADQWQQHERYGYWPSVYVERGNSVDFDYRVDNHRFSIYMADVDVTLWRSQQKLSDLLTEKLTVKSFDSGQVKWSLDTAKIVPADFPPEQSYDCTVVINRGEIERRIIINVNPAPYSPKPVIVEPQR